LDRLRRKLSDYTDQLPCQFVEFLAEYEKAREAAESTLTTDESDLDSALKKRLAKSSVWDFSIDVISLTENGNQAHAMRFCSVASRDARFAATALFLLIRIALRHQEWRPIVARLLLTELIFGYGLRKLARVPEAPGVNYRTASENPFFGALLSLVSFWNDNLDFYFDFTLLYQKGGRFSSLSDDRNYPTLPVRVPIGEVRDNIQDKDGRELFDNWTNTLMRYGTGHSICS
jgi:hypothetical protein